MRVKQSISRDGNHTKKCRSLMKRKNYDSQRNTKIKERRGQTKNAKSLVQLYPIFSASLQSRCRTASSSSLLFASAQAVEVDVEAFICSFHPPSCRLLPIPKVPTTTIPLTHLLHLHRRPLSSPSLVAQKNAHQMLATLSQWPPRRT